jgi:hypothetical protein
MAFSPLIRRAITKTHTLRSSWGLVERFLTHSTISNNNDKIVENVGRGLDSNRCYSNASSVGGAGLPSYMRAAVFWEPNKPLTLEEFRIPRPKAGEILIKTKGILLILLMIILFCFVFGFAFVVVWLRKRDCSFEKLH